MIGTEVIFKQKSPIYNWFEPTEMELRKMIICRFSNVARANIF